MSFSFPDKDDVRLEAPPLVEVICQVRFAPMLRIAGGLPVEYQELLRQRFPQFDKREQLLMEMKGIGTLPNEFIFKTADGKSSAALGVDFVAFSTHEYLGWASFISDLKTVLEAFVKVYGEPRATRIGLRYINELRFANTGADSLNSLVDFLNPDLTNLYHNPTLNQPEKFAGFVLLHEKNEFLGLRFGIDSAHEPGIGLDFDYYVELAIPTEMSIGALIGDVSRYHRIIYNAFRWSIREGKIDFFRPIQ